MIKFSEIKPGDIFIAEFDGQKVRGTVKDVNREIKEVCIDNGVQEFWFTADHLHPVPLDEAALADLGFSKEEHSDGTVKFKKDSFRLLLARKGDFSELDIWWREDRRHLHQPLYVHDLQNHYYDMTKTELNP